MTLTVTPPSTPPSRQRWSRRRCLSVLGGAVLGVILALGVAGMITVRHMDGQYGPVSAGPASGPYAGFPTRPQSAPTPGATGQVFATLSNYGSHAVTISGLRYGQYRDLVIDIQWSTWNLAPEGSIFGVDTPWHSFPATVPGNGSIRVLISIRRPADCGNFQGMGVGGDYFNGGMVVQWKSLLHTHSTDVAAMTQPIKVC